MTVIKRTKANSSADLIKAIEELIPLLKDQKELDACEVLVGACDGLKKNELGSSGQKEAVAAVIDAFEGDHELNAYTFLREDSAGKWTEVEMLAHASSRVISLARRMQ